MSLFSVEYLPLHPFLLEIATFPIIIAFTSRSSGIRFAAFPLVAALAWLSVSYNDNRRRTTFYGTIGGGAFTYALQYIDTALLSQWTWDAQGPTSSLGGLRSVRADVSQRTGTWTERLSFGLYYALDMRFSGTPWEVKNVPPFSATDPKDVPSRARYLRKRTGRLLVLLLFLDLCTFGAPKDDDVMFTLDRIPVLSRLPEVSLEEIITRTFASVAFWSIIYCIIQATYNVLAIVAVATHLTEVKAWRPLYGSLFDAWSIRQFWGCFWHQCVRQKLSSPAHFITHVILGLEKGTFVARYLFLFLTFAFSGILHCFVDRVSGVPWHHIRALRFFCMQAAGIMLEDMVQALYRSYGRITSRTAGQERWHRVIGYLWVLLWLGWTTPTWSYPLMKNTDRGQMEILPFSLLRLFLPANGTQGHSLP